MTKLTCHWCKRNITRADATRLCNEYVCSGCYGNIFEEVCDDVGIECIKCKGEYFISEDLYCSSCYEHARELKCASCNDFINPDEMEMFCKACMEEALATKKEEREEVGGRT
jgi:hypothetical protein